MEELAAFQIDHPEVRLSLLAQSSGLQVSRREEDVALISTDSPPLDMIGHELGRVNWALYRRIGLEGVDAWVGAEPDSDFAADGGGVHDAMRLRFAPTANVVHTASNLQLCLASVRVGLGVSALPCVVADGATNVERVPGTTLQDGPALWILVHPDLRNAARVQRFSERIREVFARRVELL